MTTIKILDSDAPLKIEWLRSFLSVADTGGFTKAARSLHRSQPAVSTHVRELSENLGVRLFETVGGRIHLTPSGESLAREARRLLDQVRLLRETVSEPEGGVRGVVRVGAGTTAGNYVVPPLLGRFERRYREVRTTLAIGNSEKIVGLLRSNEVDVGFLGFESESEEFVSRPFAEDEIVLFASARHSLAGRRKAGLEELRRERFLLREVGSATRRHVDAWFSRRGFRPEIMELGCPETVKRAAAAGLGIGALSRFAIDWEIRAGRLAVLRVPEFSVRRILSVVLHRRKHLSNSLRALLRALGPSAEELARAHSVA